MLGWTNGELKRQTITSLKGHEELKGHCILPWNKSLVLPLLKLKTVNESTKPPDIFLVHFSHSGEIIQWCYVSCHKNVIVCTPWHTKHSTQYLQYWHQYYYLNKRSFHYGCFETVVFTDGKWILFSYNVSRLQFSLLFFPVLPQHILFLLASLETKLRLLVIRNIV